jgi:hypothetical protein
MEACYTVDPDQSFGFRMSQKGIVWIFPLRQKGWSLHAKGGIARSGATTCFRQVNVKIHLIFLLISIFSEILEFYLY